MLHHSEFMEFVVVRIPGATSLSFPSSVHRFRTGIGNLRPAKQNHPARCPLTHCSNCVARFAALYFMNSPSLQLLALNTYEELRIRNGTVL